MSFKIDITPTGTLAIANMRLTKLERNADNMRPPLKRVYLYILDLNKRRFQTRGFGTWPPLEDSTIVRKARDAETSRPLFATGRMFRAFTGYNNPDQIRFITNDRMSFSVALPYAQVHAKGGPGHHVPQRKPMEIGQLARRRINFIIRDGLLK